MHIGVGKTFAMHGCMHVCMYEYLSIYLCELDCAFVYLHISVYETSAAEPNCAFTFVGCSHAMYVVPKTDLLPLCMYVS